MSSRILSGMRPTGNLHLGNYFGAIKQFLDLEAAGEECFFFVADIHALTEVTGLTEVDSLSVEVAKNYLACGIDPAKSTLYRQSDVPEVSEITVLLGNVVKLGRLQTCTTFKDRVHNKGVPEGEVSYGLLGYPVLMAADILCVRADRVPVGQDQTQHVEMARDFARSFNHTFAREVFTIPQMNISNPLRVPGIDGADKMGKSDGNTIALLEDIAAVTKKVKTIPTQPEPGGEMQPGTRALYTLMELCSPPDVHTEYLRRYTAREGKFFGEMKQRLAEDITVLLEPIQQRYRALSADTYSDKSINMGEVETDLFASVKMLVDLNTTMDPEDFKIFRKFYMVTDHRGLEGPSGAHSGAIPEMEVLLFWNWLWPGRDKYIIGHYGYFPRENRERIRTALRQPSLVQLVEREGRRHNDIRSLMLAVAKFMVAFSGKHYGAVQRHLPDVLANKAPGTSVAEKSGDFLSAIKDERQQQLNKLIEIF